MTPATPRDVMDGRHAVHYSSARTGENAKDLWRTPRYVFDPLHEEFRFDIDAAASDGELCRAWYGPGGLREDALVGEWARGATYWMNPPYSKLRAFVAKAHEAAQAGRLVVALIPARTDTRAWHEHVMKAAEIRLIAGRVRFVGGKASAPFPSAVVVWRPGEHALKVTSWKPSLFPAGAAEEAP